MASGAGAKMLMSCFGHALCVSSIQEEVLMSCFGVFPDTGVFGGFCHRSGHSRVMLGMLLRGLLGRPSALRLAMLADVVGEAFGTLQVLLVRKCCSACSTMWFWRCASAVSMLPLQY